MRVLTAVASRHGGAHGIADRLAATMRRLGCDADVRKAEDVGDLPSYDAVILGSAIYMGRWLDDAVRFRERFAAELRQRPLWVFSSGPLGDPRVPADVPAGHRAAVDALNPRSNHVFSGRPDPSDLHLSERLITKAVHAAGGDIRDWDEITSWAAEIVGELMSSDPAAMSDPAAEGLR